MQSVVSGKTTYSFFWEFYPLNGEQVVGPDVSPGDDVYVEVNYVSSGVTQFTIDNSTTQEGASFDEYWGSGYTEGGGTAEWIMERQPYA